MYLTTQPVRCRIGITHRNDSFSWGASTTWRPRVVWQVAHWSGSTVLAGDQYQRIRHVQSGRAGLIDDECIVSTLSSKRASAGALKKLKYVKALIGAGISS